MDGNPTTRTGARVTIGDTVTFVHQSRTWTGTVVKKHRVSAHVVCGHHRGFRVPYALLTVSPGTGRPPGQNPTGHRRAAFHPGDRVQFVLRGTTVVGLLARLNPQRARELLEYHQLSLWSFHFDNSRKRAGCCQYGTQVISLSYEFAKYAPEEEILDTILHEIAHALVGKAHHHHDDVWRTKALAIGCSGRRCHDLLFTPLRYIVQCERGCWVTTTERRRRHVLCRRCRGELVYQTYTDERWQRTQAATREGTERQGNDERRMGKRKT